MDLPNAKDLKKLADACRKAGIKSFKGNGIEFTLSDDAPVSNYKKSKGKETKQDPGYLDQAFESDSLEDDALLFWSVGDPVGQKETS